MVYINNYILRRTKRLTPPHFSILAAYTSLFESYCLLQHSSSSFLPEADMAALLIQADITDISAL